MNISRNEQQGGDRAAWRATLVRDLVIVLVFATIAIVLRAGDIPLRGEETRRGEFAIEMLRSGDWIDMTQQGEPFIDRPPGQYWAIAASFALAGGVEPGVNAGVTRWALRAPTLIATLLTTLLVWWIARRSAGDLAGLTAGIAYPTMAMVLDIGRRAETEAQFTLLLGAALLIWQHLYVNEKPPWVYFAVGYVLCAFAALTKGTQAPVAFCGTLILFLAWRRDWRTLFSPAHVLGIVLFLLIVAAWQIPSFEHTGWSGFWDTWFLEAANRTQSAGGEVTRHIFTFPLELFSELLPWGLILIGLALPSFWRGLNERSKSTAIYLLITVVTVAVPVWLVAQARVRYAMPLVPGAAVLIGLVVARGVDVTGESGLARLTKWSIFAGGTGAIAAAISLLLITLLRTDHSPEWMQLISLPLWVACIQALIGVIAGGMMMKLAGRMDEVSRRRSILVGGLITAMLCSVTIVNFYIKRSRDFETAIAQDRVRIPDERLVSLGPVYHQFVYCWRRPIEIVPFTKPPENAAWRYFVFNLSDAEGTTGQMPEFKWREVDRIAMGATRQGTDTTVVIGERLE